MSLERRHRSDNASSHRSIESSVERGAGDGSLRREVGDRTDPLRPRRPVEVQIDPSSGGSDLSSGGGAGGDGSSQPPQSGSGGSGVDRSGYECPACRLANSPTAVFCSSCGMHMGRYRQASGSLSEARKLLASRKYQESIAAATRGLSTNYLQEELSGVRTSAQFAFDRLQSLRLRIETLWKRGQYDEVESLLREALDLDPSQPDLQAISQRLPERRRAKHVRTLKSTLDELCASGQHERAASILDELRRTVPDDPEVLRFEDEIPRAVRRHKSSPHIKRAELALRGHESESAKRHAEAALRHDPFSEDARKLHKLAERMIAERAGRLRRAQALAQEHRVDEAITLVRELTRRCETDREARILLGTLIDRKRRVDGLRDAAESSLRRRRLADAARAFAELDRVDPGHPAAAEGLERCRLLKRRRLVRRSVVAGLLLVAGSFGVWIAVGGGSRASMVRDGVVSLADRARVIGAFGGGNSASAEGIDVVGDTDGRLNDNRLDARDSGNGTVMLPVDEHADSDHSLDADTDQTARDAVRESVRSDMSAALRTISASMESARLSMAEMLADGAEALVRSGQFADAARAAAQLSAYADLERPAEVISLVRQIIEDERTAFAELAGGVSDRFDSVRASPWSGSARVESALSEAASALHRARAFATALRFDDARVSLKEAGNKLNVATGLVELESMTAGIAEHGLLVRLDVASFRTVRVRLVGAGGARTGASWTLRGPGEWTAPGGESAPLVEQLPVTVEILRPPTGGGTVLATLTIGRLPSPNEVLVIKETGATEERAIGGVIDRPGTWSWEIVPR